MLSWITSCLKILQGFSLRNHERRGTMSRYVAFILAIFGIYIIICKGV